MGSIGELKVPVLPQKFYRRRALNVIECATFNLVPGHTLDLYSRLSGPEMMVFMYEAPFPSF